MLEYFDEFVSAKLFRFSAGSYVDGVWVEGVLEAPVAIDLIVPQPVTENELQMVTDGESVRDFRKTYCKELLRTRESNNDSDKIEYKGVFYKVYQVDDRSVLGDYYKIIIRKIDDHGEEYNSLFVNDQSTLHQTKIYIRAIGSTDSLRLYWGDGSYTDPLCNGTLETLIHDYSKTGCFIIGMTGDPLTVTNLRVYSQTFLSGNLFSMKDMINLSSLWLHTTGMIGDIVYLSSMTGLGDLYLNSTKVSGNIANLSAMLALTYTDFYNSEITGDIACLSHMINLISLKLANTKVIGELNSLCTLDKLTHLFLYDNAITYSTAVQPLNWKTSVIRAYNCSWSIAMVDQMLIDHDDIDTSGYSGELQIHENNAAHTNPGLAEDARLSLIAKGKSVLVN